MIIKLLALALAVVPQQNMRHRYKVMVIIPETHISRPRIPDPAAETEINRQLIDAEYKVVDPQRTHQLISFEMQDRLMRKDKMAIAETIRIARKAGADYIVTGEAFTMVETSNTSNTSLGSVQNIFCRARVELKAYATGTGQLAFADAITKTGTPEPTEELSSKTALQQAAGEIGPRVISGLDRIATSSSVTVEVVLRNVTYSQGSALREVLRRTANATEISEGEFEAKTWTFDVQVPRTQLPRLGYNFERSASLKKMHLVIQDFSKTKVILNRKGQ